VKNDTEESVEAVKKKTILEIIKENRQKKYKRWVR
jgi:hypothetical protein